MQKSRSRFKQRNGRGATPAAPPQSFQDTEMTGLLGLDDMRDLLHQACDLLVLHPQMSLVPIVIFGALCVFCRCLKSEPLEGFSIRCSV